MTELTSLATIDHEVRQRVTSLLKNPELPGSRETPTTFIAGIAVVDKRHADSELDTFINKMKKYQKDAAALEKKLTQAGVTYLAIMPTTMWNGMCDDAGLYRFSPDAEGRVGADDSVLLALEESAVNTLGMRPLRALTIGGLIGGASGAAIAVATSLSIGLIVAAAAATALVGSYIFGAIVEGRNFERSRPRPDKLAKIEAGLLAKQLSSHETTLAALWPNRTDGDRFKVKISVPPAPGDVQENLSRAAAAELQLSLAVVGEAISFDENPTSLLLARRGQRYQELAAEIQSIKDAEEAARRQKAWENDPIVTTSLGLATAAIVQYGDFPIEQAVVERALEECYID
jgi:hypothetical protein